MFYRSSKENRHYHVVVATDAGVAFCSESKQKKHRHEIAIANGAVVLLPGGDDGHTHTIEGEVGAEQTKDKKTDTEIVDSVRRLFKEAKELERDFRKAGYESEEFYEGKQWKESDKAELESQGRPALTINEIEPKIDVLKGYQARTRYDMRFFPVEGGDSIVADILTALVKNITEQNNFTTEESMVFEDQAIVGRGSFDVAVDYEKTIEGDIAIDRFPWDDCYLGPHDKIDASDLEYLVKAKWYSLAKLKSEWPEKAEEVTEDFSALKSHGPGQSQHHVQHKDYPDDNDMSDDRLDSMLSADPDFVDIARKSYRVLECWQREYTRIPVLAHGEADIYQNADGWSRKDIEAVMTIPGFVEIKRRVSKMRITRIAGCVVLDDGISDVFDDFGLIPVYAKKKRKKVWGKVENVKDAQREANKRHSQVTDIINKVASYGYFYDQNTFLDPKDERYFKKNSSKPGHTTKVANLNNKPQQTDGIKFPAEVATLMANQSQKIRELMNINEEMLGMAGGGDSGVAIARKQQAGLMGNEYLFDNLSLAKRSLGRLLVKLIQKVYTPERMSRILQTINQRTPETPIELAGQPIAKYPIEVLQALLDNADLTRYDVAVGESKHSPTARMINFALWSELAAKGAPVPFDLLIELSDLPDKDRVRAMVAQQNQMQAQAENKKYDTEIAKSQIAAQSKVQQGGLSMPMPQQ